MYKIDLLKNQGISKKISPLLTIIITAAISVPMIFCVLVAIEYMSNQIQIKFNSDILSKMHENFESTPYDKRLDNRLQQEFGFGLSAINEILIATDRNLQWTSTLNEIVSLLPEKLAIADFDVRKDIDKKRIEDPDNKGRRIEVETIERTLRMTVFSLSQENNNDEAQNYIKALNQSEILKDSLESAKISVIRVEEFGNLMLPCYLIECKFKTGYKD